MRVLSISLKNFRNYDLIRIRPDNNKNIFVGNNAQGKSNLLEAIYCLSNIRSFRTSIHQDMIKWNTEGFFIKGNVLSSNSENDIKIYYSLKKKVLT